MEQTNLKISLTVFAVLLQSFLITGCGNKDGDKFVVGATLPLSGEAAQWGNNTRNGIELAREQINENGGVNGKLVEVVYEDTKALPAVGVNAYRKLVAFDQVQAIIDNAVSSVALAMAPFAQQDSVVIVSTGATAPALSEAGEFFFRIWNSDSYEGEVAAGFAYNEISMRAMAILSVNNEYGTGLERVFSKEFESLGGEIVTSQSFEQDSQDFRTQLAKIKGSGAEGVYLVGYPKETPLVLRQATELGVKALFVGTVAMEGPELLALAGKSAEGLYYPFPVSPAGSHLEKFKKDFEAAYGDEPGLTCDVGYDAMMMIAEAIKSGGGFSGNEIRIGLNSLVNYQGVSGTMTFDENGDVRKPMAIKVVRSGKAVWLE